MKNPARRGSIGGLLQRETLLHRIVLHLNPSDEEDLRIKTIKLLARELSEQGDVKGELPTVLTELRDATGGSLKKEWNRVQDESEGKGCKAFICFGQPLALILVSPLSGKALPGIEYSPSSSASPPRRTSPPDCDVVPASAPPLDLGFRPGPDWYC